MSLDLNIEEKIEKLKEKYAAMGQDMNSYLDGLLYADYLNYWDYIHLDVLLNLQKPRTRFPDERIFIIYHQITELYFKLILLALDQLTIPDPPDLTTWNKQLNRVNSYLDHLINSFSLMKDGMDKDQFLKFRMALLPASGFQSAQYRIIEFACTDLHNLVSAENKSDKNQSEDIKTLYEKVYWKKGGIELKSGKKTLTLKMFEEKYEETFLDLLEKYRETNLWKSYKKLSPAEQKDEMLVKQMRLLDLNLEVRWPLEHYRSSVNYLQQDPQDIAATGGTNWQKYLPPKFQQVVLFPQLWEKQELKDWGVKTKR